MLNSEEISSTNTCTENLFILIIGSWKPKEDIDISKLKKLYADSLSLNTSEARPKHKHMLIMRGYGRNGQIICSLTISQIWHRSPKRVHYQSNLSLIIFLFMDQRDLMHGRDTSITAEIRDGLLLKRLPLLMITKNSLTILQLLKAKEDSRKKSQK